MKKKKTLASQSSNTALTWVCKLMATNVTQQDNTIIIVNCHDAVKQRISATNTLQTWSIVVPMRVPLVFFTSAASVDNCNERAPVEFAFSSNHPMF